MASDELKSNFGIPYAYDVESSVIGAILADNRCVDDVMSIITTENVFYDVRHLAIFHAIMSLYRAGNPIDLVTVSMELKKLGLMEQAGGDFYLISITQKISSSAHVEYHSRILLQKFICRNVISFSTKIIGLAQHESTDVFEMLHRWQKEFDKVIDFTTTGRTTISFSDSLRELKKNIEFLSNNTSDQELVGIDTGFKNTNRYTGGYRNQDLVIIAARPGMGKTAKVLKTAIENAKKGIPVGFISIEMSMAQLTARAVAIDTNFHLNQLIKKGFEKTEYFNTLENHIHRMSDYPLLVDDSGNSDISDVVITAKLWKRKNNIGLLIIDYMQLMVDRQSKGTRENELSSISRRLKKLAKELDIPVVVLAQVNRDCEKRPNKRPFVSDIKDCGSIEQDADIIEFIYRPEYYKQEMNEDDYPSEISALIDKGANTEIIYAKYRAGSTGTTLLKFIGDKTKFVDVMDYSDPANIESSVIMPGDLKDAF